MWCASTLETLGNGTCVLTTVCVGMVCLALDVLSRTAHSTPVSRPFVCFSSRGILLPICRGHRVSFFGAVEAPVFAQGSNSSRYCLEPPSNPGNSTAHRAGSWVEFVRYGTVTRAEEEEEEEEKEKGLFKADAVNEEGQKVLLTAYNE